MSDEKWQAIRAEYESGASLRSLAAKHGVSKTYIIEKRNKEQWNRPTTDRPLTNRPHAPTPVPLSLPADASTIARIGLQQLAQHLQTDEILSISSHKSLSDALAQYVKVLLTAPQGESTRGIFVDLSKLPAWKRMELQRLLAEDEPSREAV